MPEGRGSDERKKLGLGCWIFFSLFNSFET